MTVKAHLLLAAASRAAYAMPGRPAFRGAAPRLPRRPALAMSSSAPTANPLAIRDGLPKYSKIAATHVVPAITEALADLDSGLSTIEADLAATPSSFADVVEPLEKLRFPLEYSWGVVGHLNGVCNSDDLRAAHAEMQPQVVQAMMKMTQSKPVYDAFAALEKDAAKLTPAEARIVEASVRGMRNGGVALEGAAKERYAEIAQDLAKLSTDFSNNVLDATKAFELVLTDAKDVAGLPPTALAMAAQNAAENGSEGATLEAGPWRLTLDGPSYLSTMKHCKSAEVREAIYRGFGSRASSGDHNNEPLVKRILQLRNEASKLLGYASFADKSLSSKMADDVAAVDTLTIDLLKVAKPAAERDLAELRAFAASKGAGDDLKHWDLTFWAERLKEEKYAFEEEALRPYFPLPSVLQGMFDLASRLFGIEITEAPHGSVELWHPDARFFNVKDKDTGAEVASFYLDPYARPAEKRGGAWMDSCLGRSKALGTSPVAYLTCNGSPAVGDAPSLMTFSEVTTLFHEFGHGLQHMLTTVDDGECSGINGVEWDAVELPSQFMENWLYHKPTVDAFARHYQTGEPLPPDVFAKIEAVRTFQAGGVMCRQLQFGALDMELHARYDPDSDETPLDVERRIADTYAIMPPLPESRFLCAFSHIMAGGYAAGYYSYKWAEVMSADAYGAFEEAGLDDPEAIAKVGRRFKDTVLALGGSEHPTAVFKKFRGREPSVDALLRHAGLTQEAK